MYAVVTTGGKQYKVQQGDLVRVEKLEAEIGATVEFDRVCLVAKDDGVLVAPKDLAGTKVLALVKSHGRGKKIRVFKYKRRKNYRRTQGHRQDYTEVQINAIQG